MNGQTREQYTKRSKKQSLAKAKTVYLMWCRGVLLAFDWQDARDPRFIELKNDDSLERAQQELAEQGYSIFEKYSLVKPIGGTNSGTNPGTGSH